MGDMAVDERTYQSTIRTRKILHATVGDLASGDDGIVAYRIVARKHREVALDDPPGVVGSTIGRDFDPRVHCGICFESELRRAMRGDLSPGKIPHPALERQCKGLDPHATVVLMVKPSYVEALVRHGYGSDRGSGGPWDDVHKIEDPVSDMGEPYVLVEADISAHMAYTYPERLPLPVALYFDYIEAQMVESRFDLVKAAEILMGRPDVTLRPHGGERGGSYRLKEDDPRYWVGGIPGYNAAPGQTECLAFYWHPSVEDYRQAWTPGCLRSDVIRAALGQNLLGLDPAKRTEEETKAMESRSYDDDEDW